MAKKKNAVQFKNVFIDPVELDGKTIMIEEINRDDSQTYNLCKILAEFAGLEGVSISVNFDSDIEGDN